MGRFFGRVVSVTVADDLGNGFEVSGLRVAFKVKKTLKKEPNTLDLKIFNLAEKTRSGIQKKGARIIVKAGHEDNGGAVVIFQGDARTVDHVRDGTEWVTHIQCGDGERAYQFPRLNQTFGPGTSVKDIVIASAKSMGVDLGNASKVGDLAVKAKEFAHGFTAQGNAAKTLDRAVRSAGLEWSIQDGRLQILRPGDALPTTAILLSPETGLIGSPDHGTPEAKGKPPMLKLKAILQGAFVCGGPVEVRAEGARGLFRIVTLEHEGDTAGANFYTNIEALPAS